ncbi:uncharacterized protein LOC62_02G002598 [Vanrija pseudolonga]|uniref:Uncharacterized protein n=1 Tax=Vanrija pseudolonga TaxID=143232 RepID=A0AAF1BG21_9TREE|nr:hypothetical protein LOC62_02G002598 [Vanrija pseudolonga]
MRPTTEAKSTSAVSYAAPPAHPPPPPPAAEPDEELPPYSPCRGGPSCRDHNSTAPQRPSAPRHPSYSAWAPSVVHSRAGLSRLRAMERVESDEERRERVRREQEAELAHWREQVALATILREAEEEPRRPLSQRQGDAVSHPQQRGLDPVASSAAPAPSPSPPSSSALGLHGLGSSTHATPVAASSPPRPTSRTRPRAGTSPAPHSRSPSSPSSSHIHQQPPLSHTSSSSSLSSYRSSSSTTPATPPDSAGALPLPLPAWCNSPAPTPRLTRSASAPDLALLTLQDLEAAYTPVRVPLLRRKVTPNHLRRSHPVPSRMDSRTATTASRTTSRTSAESSRRERNPWSPSGIAERLSPRALVERSPSPPPQAPGDGNNPPSPSRNRPFSFFRRPTRTYPARAEPEPLPHGHEHSAVYGRPAQHPQSEHTYARVPPRLFEQWPTRLPIEYKLWCTPFLGYDDVPVEEEVVGVISEM